MQKLDPDRPNLGAGVVFNLGDQWGLGLIHIWSVNDIKRPVWRITVFLLFWTRLLLLAIPAGVTFLQVIRHLIT